MEKIKILIADDHPLIRNGLRLTFSGSRYRIVGEAINGAEAVKSALKLKPDVVIMDIAMPELDGIQAAEKIREASPGMKIIILTLHQNVMYMRKAFKAGVMGFVVKGAEPEELSLAVDKVVSGKRYVSPEVSEQILGDYAADDSKSDPLAVLSAREREVLKLVVDGAKAVTIAQKLSISVSTVKKHRQNTMKKLGITELAGLIKTAMKAGL